MSENPRVSQTIQKFTDISTDSILLDAELFIKYKSPEKAINLLKEAIQRSPRSIPLREKLRETCSSQVYYTEAARQCLALASLYIAREEFDIAYDRLQEAKLLDPRISVASGLDAIRKARQPDFNANRDNTAVRVRTDLAFAGNISVIGLFDAIQAIENSRLTGLLVFRSELGSANITFNLGKIVDAEANGRTGKEAFRQIVDINSGTFEFSLSEEEFPVFIHISSNTNFILDVLTEMDSEKAEKEGHGVLDMSDW
jgi:tetratricopeptide (TPR) repeat protein